MLMGDGADIPWRLLHIEFLMEDYETGGKKQHKLGSNLHYYFFKSISALPSFQLFPYFNIPCLNRVDFPRQTYQRVL